MFSDIVSERWVGSILVERLSPSGAYRITRVGYRTDTYYGYSQREALKLYRRKYPAQR